MADTQPLAPTDAEIIALLRPLYASDEAASMGAADDLRTARAVLAKWGAQPVPAGYALVPVDPTYVNIQQRCAEVMEWRRTGILRGNALSEYSEEHWAGYTHALQLAEQETAAQAMTVIAKLVAQPVPCEPLTEQQLVDIFRSIDSEDKGRWAVVVSFARAIERAHGITGGQHGAE